MIKRNNSQEQTTIYKTYI